MEPGSCWMPWIRCSRMRDNYNITTVTPRQPQMRLSRPLCKNCLVFKRRIHEAELSTLRIGENRMNKVTCSIAMSLDAFVAGPNQRFENPFGDIPENLLHHWMLAQD